MTLQNRSRRLGRRRSGLAVRERTLPTKRDTSPSSTSPGMPPSLPPTSHSSTRRTTRAFVAVKLNNVNPGQLLHIECRAWAKNIKYNRRDRVGIVRFELIAHDEKSANQVNELA